MDRMDNFRTIDDRVEMLDFFWLHIQNIQRIRIYSEFAPIAETSFVIFYLRNLLKGNFHRK
jgi:hypothetical protein